ncbi:MAG: hypothetical protein A2Z20_01360 [Bdellovibrionales bacterium RBG_16_40_8]|nr:MAG: hypothetical protein A2Z20_01360 [Bdellovibrionales bacterium RBG_16_40_8]
MSRMSLIGAFVAIVVAIILLIKMNSIAEFLVDIFFQKNSQIAANTEIGQVLSRRGTIYRRSPSSSDFIIIKPVTKILHMDQIKIEANSDAVIKLSSDWQLQLLENTIVALEYYRPLSPETSPVLMSIMHGGYNVINQGKAGFLFVMQDQKIFIPEVKPQINQRTIMVAPNAQQAPAEAPAEVETEIHSTQKPSDKAQHTKSGKMPDKLPNSDSETLSNTYIEQILNSQATSFSHCQQNSERDNKPSKGSILFSFTILPSGQIEKVKVLQDKISNSQLTSCATSVVERVQFKSFQGLPISLSYPLEFK